MADPLLRADEAELRRDRTSVKWSAYPSDVLPVWVAETACFMSSTARSPAAVSTPAAA